MIIKKRKAYITIKYCIVYRDNETFRVPDKYNIHIEDYFIDSCLMNLNANYTKKVIDLLSNAHKEKRNAEINIKLDNTSYQSFTVPKWATRDLAIQIENCLGYVGE